MKKDLGKTVSERERVMPALAIKIRSEREAKHLSQGELAKIAGTNQATIDRIERGVTTHSRYLPGVLRALEIETNSVPIIAAVTESGAVHSILNTSAPTDFGDSDNPQYEQISSPPGVQNGIAVRVQGAALWPRYVEGDVLVFEKTLKDLPSLLDKTCLVQLADGSTWLRVLQKGSRPGLYTLAAHNAPPMSDVLVARAYPVVWVKPA
jgi:transcriptional regulator with XRE-family HTH domain